MRRGALTPRGVHLPALVPALAEGLLASGAATLLLCDVAAVVPAGDGFEVDLVAPDGWRRVRARRVFDTSTTALSLRSAAAPPAPKRLHAALNTMGGGGDGPLPSGEGFRLIAGAFVREAYLSLDIPADADWPAAREALHAFWTGRPETLKQRGPGVFELPIHRHDFAIIQVE